MIINESSLKPSSRLRVAFLLLVVGGYLDAYTYYERGGVFANAQTGNIVKLGISLAERNYSDVLLFLFPILSFAIGVFMSLFLEEILHKKGFRLVRRGVLIGEMIVLIIVGFIPLGGTWDAVANCLVSFATAMQFQSFASFRGEVIATTMSTGNLRKFIVAFYEVIFHKDKEKRIVAFTYASAVVLFVLGAYVGAVYCQLMGPAAVVPAIVGLGITVAVITSLHHHPEG